MGGWLPSAVGTIVNTVSPVPIPIPIPVPPPVVIIVNETVEAGKDAATTVADTVDDAANTVVETAKDVATGVGDLASSMGQDIADLAKGAPHNIMSTGRNIVYEGHRTIEDVGDAIDASAEFVRKMWTETPGDIASEFAKRAHEGKLIDAFFHAAIGPARDFEENAAIAMQESEVIRESARIAAASYGGPQGAAAFAAWYTYKETKDPNLAIKAGLIAGVTASANQGIMNSDYAVAEKALFAGTVGGVAVAAAGGDGEEAIKGFVLSGGMVLIQDGYQKYTGKEMDGRVSSRDPYCSSVRGGPCSPPDDAFVRNSDGTFAKDAKGRPIVNPRYLDGRAAQVGFSDTSGTPIGFGEKDTTMVAVSKIPGANAMAILHDTFVFDYEPNLLATVGTIIPAVVITYIGLGAPAAKLIQESIVLGREGVDLDNPPALDGEGDDLAQNATNDGLPTYEIPDLPPEPERPGTAAGAEPQRKPEGLE